MSPPNSLPCSVDLSGLESLTNLSVKDIDELVSITISLYPTFFTLGKAYDKVIDVTTCSGAELFANKLVANGFYFIWNLSKCFIKNENMTHCFQDFIKTNNIPDDCKQVFDYWNDEEALHTLCSDNVIFNVTDIILYRDTLFEKALDLCYNNGNKINPFWALFV